MANIERIKKIVEVIEANRDPKLHFDMAHWLTQIDDDNLTQETLAPEEKCGTAMCFAGWAAYTESANFLMMDHAGRRGAYAIAIGLDGSGSPRQQPISDWAKDYFDFTDEQADEIFYSSDYDINTVDDLKGYIEEVLETKIW